MQDLDLLAQDATTETKETSPKFQQALEILQKAKLGIFGKMTATNDVALIQNGLHRIGGLIVDFDKALNGNSNGKEAENLDEQIAKAEKKVADLKAKKEALSATVTVAENLDELADQVIATSGDFETLRKMYSGLNRNGTPAKGIKPLK